MWPRSIRRTMSFQLGGVPVTRGHPRRPPTRAELYVQARQLGVAGCSRMRKRDLARAVARERRRPATIRAAARACRLPLASVALAPAERPGAIPALLPRAGRDRASGWTPAALAALGRLRWVDRVALPLAVVALAAFFGAATPLLLAGDDPVGVPALDLAAPIAALPASADAGELERPRPVTRAGARARSAERATSIGFRGAAGAAGAVVQETRSNASDRASGNQAPGSDDGTSEPAAGPAPSPEAPPDAEEPAPQPTPVPPDGPVEEEPEESEPAGAKTAICHKPDSKNPKTVVVGSEAVAEHLAHGDTAGECP
jgi:hypothetical protein